MNGAVRCGAVPQLKQWTGTTTILHYILRNFMVIHTRTIRLLKKKGTRVYIPGHTYTNNIWVEVG